MVEYRQFEQLRRRKLKAGECLFKEGDPGDYAYIIEEGEIEIFRQIDHEKHTLGTLKPGSIFGEISILDGRHRSASAIATQETLLTIVTRDQVEIRLKSADPILQMLLLVVTRYFRLAMIQSKSQEAELELARSPLDNAIDLDNRISQAVDLIRMESDLRTAVDEQQFRLLYQPIIHLASGEISGFEALIRWQSPTRGFVRPDVFMTLAESTSLIVPIGKWVMEESAKSLKKMQEETQKKLFMSINIASRQIEEPDFLETLLEKVNTVGIKPEELKLEILERSLFNREVAVNWVKECHGQNFNLVLDDFGTGYSSLHYLNEYDLDGLKIDRSFVWGLGVNPQSPSICQAIIDLSKSLKMTVVAEGIETEAQAQALKEMGCTYGQGYFFAKPMPLEEAIAIIKRN
jgi:EAL domain-containing protein (putative c-di-GMP-specific phosphodiesterase class I)/CRP-like cAMP-binding protein